MADIVSEEEIEVFDSKPKLSYEDLHKTDDELLDDSQSLASHYASLKKNFQKLSLEFENLKKDNEKLRHEKTNLLKENNLFQKDVTALETEAFEVAQKASSYAFELQKTVKFLKSDLEKMVNGSKNLGLMLGSQRPYVDKIGLGFEKEEDEKSSEDSQSKISSCILALRRNTLLKEAFLEEKQKDIK